MKKLYSIMAIFSLLMCVSCDKGEENEPVDVVDVKSEFKLEKSEVSMGAEGGTATINYTVTNHQSSAVVLSECKDNWIKDINTATFGSISFTVLPNYIQESRETRITVSYTAIEEKYEIVVKQEESKVASFTYEVTHKDATSITINVIPADITTPFVCRTYTKAHIDAFNLQSDLALVQYDLDAISNEARAASQTTQNYLHNISHTGKSYDISFTELVPDTEYVIYCYHIDLNTAAATTGKVYREVISTEEAQTITENIAMSFDVEGAHISQTVTPENNDTYYYTEAWAKDDFHTYFGADATPEDIFPHRWNEQVTIKLQSGYNALSIIAELCHQGTKTIEYNELKEDTEYIFYVFGVDADTAFVSTDIFTEVVATEKVEESGMTISIEVKNIFSTSADIYFTASDPNATFRRSVLTKAQYDACGTTDEERFAAFEYNGYVNSYTATGYTDINYTKGEAGVTFVAFAFGVDGETPNTGIFTKEFTFMSDVPGSSNIDFLYSTHYNLAEVAAVDAEHWGEYTTYNNYALVPMTINGVTEGDQVYYMVDTRVIDWQKESQWLAEVAQDRHLKNHYHNCYFMLEYGKEYTIVAVAKDKSGNIGTLYLEEMIVFASDSADVASYNYVEVK